MKLTGTNSKGRHLPGNVVEDDVSDVEKCVKISGTAAKKGQHLHKNVVKKANVGTDRKITGQRSRKVRIFYRVLKLTILGISVVAAVAITILVLDIFGGSEVVIKPPTVNLVPRPGLAAPPGPETPDTPATADTAETQDDSDEQYGPMPGDDPPDEEAFYGRIPGIFTFLVLCTDGLANTDAIMFVTFDTSDPDNYRVDVASLPRDTLMNCD